MPATLTSHLDYCNILHLAVCFRSCPLTISMIKSDPFKTDIRRYFCSESPTGVSLSPFTQSKSSSDWSARSCVVCCPSPACLVHCAPATLASRCLPLQAFCAFDPFLECSVPKYKFLITFKSLLKSHFLNKAYPAPCFKLQFVLFITCPHPQKVCSIVPRMYAPSSLESRLHHP